MIACFEQKIELALSIIEHARKREFRYGWIGTDAAYGKGPGYCSALDEMGEIFKLWTLIATKSLGKNQDVKISLTNAPGETTFKRLSWMQRQKYWIERTFEDAKSECGMTDYQVRKWSAWHHHMALVMMSMLFMLSERINHKDTYPFLSCADIEELLSHFLPRRDRKRSNITIGTTSLAAYKSHRVPRPLPEEKESINHVNLKTIVMKSN